MNKLKLGFALCGSFCTFDKNLVLMEELSREYDIVPIMSFNAATLDTRFGKAEFFVKKVEEISGRKPICTIQDAEPIGPKHLTDLMLVSPCTGNTLAKLANSIVDTPVTMAVKSHLRNSSPVIIAVSTNDGLCGCSKNIGILQNCRNYFFVPYSQDNSKEKPASIVAKFELTAMTLVSARKGVQMQPVLLAPYN